MPSGWIKREDFLVCIDSVADSSYRLILWKKEDMFSSAPELLITQGRYDAAKNEYHFRNDAYEYVFSTASQQLQVFYKNPKTMKVEVVRRCSESD